MIAAAKKGTERICRIVVMARNLAHVVRRRAGPIRHADRAISPACRASGGACDERGNDAMHQTGADTELLADFQHAHAALVEAQDSLFELGPCHAPAFLIEAPGAILATATA